MNIDSGTYGISAEVRCSGESEHQRKKAIRSGIAANKNNMVKDVAFIHGAKRDIAGMR